MAESLFSDAELEDRFSDFFEIAEEFCDNYNQGSPHKLTVDPSLLFLVVVATYDDISRYKAYHLSDPTIQRSSGIKRAAYATKWIMRFNPLIVFGGAKVKGKQAPTPAYDGLANAMFAIHFSVTNIQQFTGRFFNLTNKANYNLLYDLIYRQFGDDALIYVYEVIADMVSGVGVVDL